MTNLAEAMTQNNILADKSLAFAIRIVNCRNFLAEKSREQVMSKQLLRCGTSIGANVYESMQAQSKADFISKMSIALKEASETAYWLKLLSMTGYLEKAAYESLQKDLDEIMRIIISSIKTTKKNLEYEKKTEKQ